MAGSDDSLLNHNIVGKSPRQLTCKLYHGISRRASIIASTQQRNGKKNKLKNYTHQNNAEKLQETFTEVKPEVQTLPLTQEFSGQYQKSVVKANDLEQHTIQSTQEVLSPVTATKPYRVFYTYEPEQMPRLTFNLPGPRQGRDVCNNPEDSGQYQKNVVKAKDLEQHAIQSTQEVLSPVTATKPYKIFYTYEPEQMPCFTFNRPGPRQEQSTEDYLFRTLQDMEETLLPEMHRRTYIFLNNLNEMRDLVERQLSREDINLTVTRTDTIVTHLVLLATILVISFFTIWTSPQPIECFLQFDLNY